MSYKEGYPIVAGADLSDDEQYKAIAIGGTIAASGTAAIGILCNKPKSGEDAAVTWWGREKFYAGAAVAAGAQVTVTTSGWFITAGSGDAVVGRNGSSAVASGAIGEGMFNFANASMLA